MERSKTGAIMRGGWLCALFLIQYMASANSTRVPAKNSNLRRARQHGAACFCASPANTGRLGSVVNRPARSLRFRITLPQHCRMPAIAAYSDEAAAVAAAFSEEDIAKLRREYQMKGWVTIADFVPAGLHGALLAEATELLHSDAAFYSSDAHTVYQEPGDSAMSSDHPRNQLQQSSKRIVDYGRLSAASPLRVLYLQPSVLALVKAVAAPGRKS